MSSPRFFMVMVQTSENQIRFMDGDALTKNRDQATLFSDEAEAAKQAAKWAARSDIKAACHIRKSIKA